MGRNDSHSGIGFLEDPDNLFYEISCVSCNRALWRTKVLKRDGTHVISTETKSCDPSVKEFDRRIEFCPLCGRRYYTYKEGLQAYLIRDINTGVRRIV